MNQSRKSINDAQLRLLLPSSWIEELDTLAQVKFKTRLALIRQYLRDRIDHDFSQHNEVMSRRDQIKRAKVATERWIEGRQERTEKDEW